jgi:hypothetical protein
MGPQAYGLLLFTISVLGSWCYANNMAMYAQVGVPAARSQDRGAHRRACSAGLLAPACRAPCSQTLDWLLRCLPARLQTLKRQLQQVGYRWSKASRRPASAPGCGHAGRAVPAAHDGILARHLHRGHPVGGLHAAGDAQPAPLHRRASVPRPGARGSDSPVKDVSYARRPAHARMLQPCAYHALKGCLRQGRACWGDTQRGAARRRSPPPHNCV